MIQQIHFPPENVKAALRDRRFAAQCRVRDSVFMRDAIYQSTDYRYGEAHLAAVDARSEDRCAELLLLAMAGRIKPENCRRYVDAITYPTLRMMIAFMHLYARGVISRPAMEDASDRYNERCTYGHWSPDGKIYHRTDRLDREWRERVRVANRGKSCAPVDGDGIVRTGKTKMVDGERLPVVRVIEEQNR